MSIVFIPDAVYTMALGGVATGSMNAYEQDSVAGSIKKRGFLPKEMDWRGEMCSLDVFVSNHVLCVVRD